MEKTNQTNEVLAESSIDKGDRYVEPDGTEWKVVAPWDKEASEQLGMDCARLVEVDYEVRNRWMGISELSARLDGSWEVV